MRRKSEYHFECACGAKIVSETKEGKCVACGEPFLLDWPAQIGAALKAAQSIAA